MPELGLFPLPIVLVPTERIPLHIFEPRYRELIDECIENESEFGLVLSTGDGAVHDIGTRASVEQVLDVLDDDSLNIVVAGGERFRLLELTQGRSFTTGVVESVVDEDEPPDPTDTARALELFHQLATLTESDVDDPDPDSGQLDFELAARVDFGVEARQELLASLSPRRRMEHLAKVFETALVAVQAQKAVHERAGRNGKVTPPESLD
ncbi:MAG: LON peptidase substrate-binding domain-containing protein [Gaiellaceae bacterium]